MGGRMNGDPPLQQVLQRGMCTMAVAADLKRDVDETLPGAMADRRHLHEQPELGMQEYETAKFVVERLQALGVEDVRTGISETGVTGLIRGTADGPDRDKVVLV